MKVYPPTRDFRDEHLKNLCSRYGFLKCADYGKSICGRPLTACYIGNDQDTALLCGGFHGSEYLTVLTLLRFLEDLCESIQHKSLLEGFRMDRFTARRGICIIPCVNPDGTEIALCGSAAAGKYREFIESVTDNTSNWQANARGVDINHNFDAGWQELKKLELASGICSPAKTRYGGEYAESEPESNLLVKLCRDGNFRQAFAFHSQGREIYCDYGKNTPERSYRIAEILARSSGYTVSEPEAIATGGGFKDWFIEKLRKPAMTIEIGMGKNPLPLSDFEPEYERILEMLCFCCVL